ncbi:MAG: hypothetical protein HYV07_29100 [Deltaproteobacteria bacterium]|nr:hypothetical protein [Deltaproteobacteria bacterium]
MSAADYELLAGVIARESEKKSSRFSSALFAELLAGAGRRAYEATSGDLVATRAYLTLLAEAVSEGHVRSSAPSGFVSRALLELVPESLGRKPDKSRLDHLARTFNLLEGVASEPAWLDRFLGSRLLELPGSADDLVGFVERELEPVVSPTQSSTFEAPFSLLVLDPRPLEDEFLPGEMVLEAPNVVAVRDRRRDVWLGALLLASGRSRLFGPIEAPSGRFVALAPSKAIHVGHGFAHVGEARVELPKLTRLNGHVVAPAGFVVATAVDSQRLWVLEAVRGAPQ